MKVGILWNDIVGLRLSVRTKTISLAFSNLSPFSEKLTPVISRSAGADVTPNKSSPQSFLTR